MHHHSENPFQSFEQALSAYAKDELTHDEFLLLVEGQYRLVQTWILEIKRVREHRFPALRKHQNRCLLAYEAFCQGLRGAYAAINHRNRLALDQARVILKQGSDQLQMAQAA